MKLYLVQHGEATAKDVDPERPLADRGRSDVERVASNLSRADIRIARVFHSGKLRAAQTAEILAAQLAPGFEPESVSGIDPLDDPAILDLDQISAGSDTMLVGHLPFMEKMVAQLVCADPEQAVVDYRPGSVVCLETENPGTWKLCWMLRPELLS